MTTAFLLFKIKITSPVKNESAFWATFHKEVKVFIGSFPLILYEKIP